MPPPAVSAVAPDSAPQPKGLSSVPHDVPHDVPSPLGMPDMNRSSTNAVSLDPETEAMPRLRSNALFEGPPEDQQGMHMHMRWHEIREADYSHDIAVCCGAYSSGQ